MLAYLFPGQGSQKKGMGSELFDAFKDHTAQADEILGYSIKTLCLEDPDSLLNQTQYTQPALFTVNALSYLKLFQDNGIKPDYVSGHSLGEYNALFAAEVFDFTTGLTLVQKRGELMSQAKEGGMAAVIGMERDEMLHLIQEQGLGELCIANYNSYQQLVLSGSKIQIEKAQQILGSMKEVRCIPLTVSGAFHSPFMLGAQKIFAEFMQKFKFSMPKIPVLANINAKPYHPLILKENLIHQISQPVEWTKTMEYLLSMPEIELLEVGPGQVLTNLLKRIKNQN